MFEDEYEDGLPARWQTCTRLRHVGWRGSEMLGAGAENNLPVSQQRARGNS